MRKRTRIFFIVLLTALVLTMLIEEPLKAAGYSVLKGYIFDQNGQKVDNVVVTLMGVSNAPSYREDWPAYTTKTNSNGCPTLRCRCSLISKMAIPSCV